MNKIWVIFSYDWANTHKFGMITDQYRRSTYGNLHYIEDTPSTEIYRFADPNFKLEFFYE